MSGSDATLGRDLDLAQDVVNVHANPHSNASAIVNAPGLDNDVAIRQLLDQEADIQTRLAALFATERRRLDAPREVEMLRHKVRILEGLVDRHGAYRMPTVTALVFVQMY